MSQPTDLQTLHQLTEAVYRNEQSRLQSLNAQETEIRQRLAELNTKIRSAQAMLSELQDIQRIGADLHWQTWCLQRREALNSELARVRSLKQPVMESLARSFGRKESLEKLHRTETKRSNAKKALTRESWTTSPHFFAQSGIRRSL